MLSLNGTVGVERRRRRGGRSSLVDLTAGHLGVDRLSLLGQPYLGRLARLEEDDALGREGRQVEQRHDGLLGVGVHAVVLRLELLPEHSH